MSLRAGKISGLRYKGSTHYWAYVAAWRDASDYYEAARPDGLSDFPVGALEALKDLVMPLEELPESDRLLRLGSERGRL